MIRAELWFAVHVYFLFVELLICFCWSVHAIVDVLLVLLLSIVSWSFTPTSLFFLYYVLYFMFHILICLLFWYKLIFIFILSDWLAVVTVLYSTIYVHKFALFYELCSQSLWCAAHLPRSKLLLKIFRRDVDVARSESGELSKDGHRPSTDLEMRIHSEDAMRAQIALQPLPFT